MPRLPLAFFTTAALYLLAGTVWGAVMGASEDFTQAAAHAHWNLLGWTSLAIMGGFYALAPRYGQTLGWINFSLSNLGVLIMIPGLARLLAGHGGLPWVATGALLVILGAACFLLAVALTWRRSGMAE